MFIVFVSFAYDVTVIFKGWEELTLMMLVLPMVPYSSHYNAALLNFLYKYMNDNLF